MTLEVTALIGDIGHRRPPSVYQVWNSFGRYDAFPVSALVGLVTLTFDLWPWRSQRLSLMRVFVLRLCTKFEVRRPLTFWPLNRFTGYPCDVLPSFTNFELYRPFLSRVRSRHATDGRTDGHQNSFYNAPSLPYGGGDIIRTVTKVSKNAKFCCVYCVCCAVAIQVRPYIWLTDSG